MRTTGGNLLPLLLSVSLLSGFLLSSSYARQGHVLRSFMKIKAIGDVDTTHDLNKVLPDFNSELISQEGSKEGDKISNLPGQPRLVDFSQYGGYITVNKTAGRALYYYFVEADRNKDSKPVILWLNGGPGCSSVGYGAFEELGPFIIQKGKLIENPYSWNKMGNILFLESPAGVGFSYSNTTLDYTSTGDMRTSQEAYEFLINWLKRFPEYKNRDFYIAGESYAGHYVPQLAYTILQHNNKKGSTFINLKGISLGNPSINDMDDSGLSNPGGTLGQFEFLWRNNLISNEDWNIFQNSCDFNLPAENRTEQCQITMIVNYLTVSENTDSYNIYAPKCYDDNTNVTSGPVGADDPCVDKQVEVYLNNPKVLKAIHAKITRFDVGIPSPSGDGTTIGKWDKWAHCREVILRTWRDSPISILPLLKNLMARGTKVLISNGDLDSVIPYTATRDSIKRLQLLEHRPWHLWGNQEISGSLVVYEGNLTVATVRGAGHEVPMNQPRRAFELIQSFIEGKRLPKAKTKEDLSEMGINQNDDDDNN